jgi:hypothetical protein
VLRRSDTWNRAAPTDLGFALNGLTLTGHDLWTDEKVLAVLTRLEHVRLPDGSLGALVAKAPARNLEHQRHPSAISMCNQGVAFNARLR